MEIVEKEMLEMKGKMEEVSKQLLGMNRDVNNRMGKLETNVELLNGYLWELHDTIIRKKGNDKGKTPMG